MNLALAPQYLINGLLTGIIYATYTTGYSLVLTTSRFMHVCHGGILSVSGLLTWYLCAGLGMPLLLSALAAAGVGVLVGLFLEVAIYRRLRRRGLPFLLTMIVSLGCMTVLQNLLAMVFGTNTKYLGSEWILPSLFLGPYAVPGWQAVGFLLTAALLVGISLLLKHTRIGGEIQSVAANQEMARMIGIDLDKVHVVTMILAALLAAWVGILEVITHGINCYGGTPFMLVGIVIRALGGVRSTRGLLLAGLAYGAVENLALLLVPSRWASPLAFGIFVAAVLIRSNPTRNAMERLGGGL